MGGEKDIIKTVLEELGEIEFGRVNIKPGKPMTLARITHNGVPRLVFALPGNPISAMVCFQVFVKNILDNRHSITAKLENDAIALDPRPELHRCILDKTNGTIKTTGSQMSSKISSLARCNALAILPAGNASKNRLVKGDLVEVIMF